MQRQAALAGVRRHDQHPQSGSAGAAAAAAEGSRACHIIKDAHSLVAAAGVRLGVLLQAAEQHLREGEGRTHHADRAHASPHISHAHQTDRAQAASSACCMHHHAVPRHTRLPAAAPTMAAFWLSCTASASPSPSPSAAGAGAAQSSHPAGTWNAISTCSHARHAGHLVGHLVGHAGHLVGHANRQGHLPPCARRRRAAGLGMTGIPRHHSQRQPPHLPHPWAAPWVRCCCHRCCPCLLPPLLLPLPANHQRGRSVAVGGADCPPPLPRHCAAPRWAARSPPPTSVSSRSPSAVSSTWNSSMTSSRACWACGRAGSRNRWCCGAQWSWLRGRGACAWGPAAARGALLGARSTREHCVC